MYYEFRLLPLCWAHHRVTVMISMQTLSPVLIYSAVVYVPWLHCPSHSHSSLEDSLCSLAFVCYCIRGECQKALSDADQ